jgi:hypothetical protein
VQLYADGFGFGKHREDTRTNEAWKPWIHKHLNSGTYDAKDGKYSLQLQLAWSPYRIMVLASTPILLSLAIGIWYDVHYEEPEVAFVIATYIATAGGGKWKPAISGSGLIVFSFDRSYFCCSCSQRIKDRLNRNSSRPPSVSLKCPLPIRCKTHVDRTFNISLR